MPRIDEIVPGSDLDHEELSRFFELSVDMLCISSFDGHFKRLNRVWEQVTGFTIEELIARPFLDFVHPDDHQSTTDEVAKQLELGAQVLSFENRYLCKDGSYRWFRWTSQPDVDRQLMYAVARDVTEEKRLHALLETQAAQLEARSQSRGNELNLLHSIDRMILRGANEEEALQEIARLVAGLTGAQYAAIVTPRDDGGEVVRAIHHGVSAEEGARLSSAEFPIGEGVSGWALRHNQIAVATDISTDSRYDKMRDFAREMNYAAAVAIPIVLDEAILAALTVGYEEPRQFSQDEIATLMRIAAQAAIAVENARQRDSLERLLDETAMALSDVIESRDTYTGGHCQRLAVSSQAIAQAMGLPRREVDVIRFGAALHDLGKIVVPDAILNKPDKLTPEEYEIIKRHSSDGGRICQRIGFLQKAYDVVYHHHERWDGKGYPDGLAGEQIPQAARIVAVADAFDAMTNDRPYRRGMSCEEAIAILHDGAGSQWDARVVTVFIESFNGRLRKILNDLCPS
jgi:PAS domain S-box-containing protein/putative nucleotidyltransferase with HDIG domain